MSRLLRAGSNRRVRRLSAARPKGAKAVTRRDETRRGSTVTVHAPAARTAGAGLSYGE
ncbi:hypothetical protein ABT381_12975 [Streptomyces sp. NPDC000151]|uniref:hypothetical protein n=1 Tax=Streptomyces sp. NPDC000151 TaxID=3154244 RepID=UPI0033261AEA